jgi:hypothetical protein
MLNNQVMAFDFLKRILRRKYGSWFNYYTYNKGRHLLIQPLDRNVPVIYAIYKRDFFMSFNSNFPRFVAENPELRGVAESINKECLDIAIKRNVDYIYFVHPDEKIFAIHPMQIKKFCEKHNLIRGQQKLNIYQQPYTLEKEMVSEVTYCIPVKLLASLGVKH